MNTELTAIAENEISINDKALLEVTYNDFAQENSFDTEEENGKTRMISVGEAEKIARNIIDEDNIDELYQLAFKLLNQKKVYGSENDYHNFSLNYSKKDSYDIACRILQKGLEQFPRSVDLLSDFLQTGVNCNRIEECRMCYNTLLSIPKIRWSWRGFSFSIDYMLYLCCSLNEVELMEMKKSMISLADEYQSLFPADEDPYICKADIFSFFNDKNAVKSILMYAIENLIVWIVGVERSIY